MSIIVDFPCLVCSKEVVNYAIVLYVTIGPIETAQNYKKKTINEMII